jgi:protein-S-isoprenylcysteine O-methyltransferase Ste14
LLEFIVFAGHANLSYLNLSVPWPQFPELEPHPLLNTIGGILIFIGLIGVLAGMFRLGFGATMGQGKGSVFKKGLYRWSRNPQLVAYGIILLGWLALFPSWGGLLWFLAYLPAAHFMAVTEEEYLANQHDADFTRYCQEVPRYLPFFNKKKEGLFG